MLRTIVSIFLFTCIGVSAAQESDAEAREYLKEVEKQNFSGWAGITFICDYDESDRILAEMCRRGTSEFRFLVSTADLDYNIIDPKNFRSLVIKSTIRNHVVLTYELSATKTNSESTIKAIYGRLAFVARYSNAIEAESVAQSMGTISRAGDLELWYRTAIGSGIGENIGVALSEAFESHFKDAISHFLEYGTTR